jgi:hypothetical protein
MHKRKNERKAPYKRGLSFSRAKMGRKGLYHPADVYRFMFPALDIGG